MISELRSTPLLSQRRPPARDSERRAQLPNASDRLQEVRGPGVTRRKAQSWDPARSRQLCWHHEQAQAESLQRDVLQRLKRGQGSARTATEAVGLGSETKNPTDELVLRQDVTLLHPSGLTFADLVDHLVTLNRPSCTTKLTKMLLGTDPLLDGTVILVQDVIQILNWTVPATPS